MHRDNKAWLKSVLFSTHTGEMDLAVRLSWGCILRLLYVDTH
jgi:hypothetical protein